MAGEASISERLWSKLSCLLQQCRRRLRLPPRCVRVGTGVRFDDARLDISARLTEEKLLRSASTAPQTAFSRRHAGTPMFQAKKHAAATTDTAAVGDVGAPTSNSAETALSPGAPGSAQQDRVLGTEADGNSSNDIAAADQAAWGPTPSSTEPGEVRRRLAAERRAAINRGARGPPTAAVPPAGAKTGSTGRTEPGFGVKIDLASRNWLGTARNQVGKRCTELLLARLRAEGEEKIVAIPAMCPHRLADLSFGRVLPDIEDSAVVECPMHHWLWRLEDGREMCEQDNTLKSSVVEKPKCDLLNLPLEVFRCNVDPDTGEIFVEVTEY